MDAATLFSTAEARYDRWLNELRHKVIEARTTYDALIETRTLTVEMIPADCQRARIVAQSAWENALRFHIQVRGESVEKELSFKELSRAVNEFSRRVRELVATINAS
jgi:hypothetical protein